MKRVALAKRGFLLVFALLLTVLISMIALGVLGLKKGGYASSQAAVNSIQARSLARAGMADIWVKISKDPFFPAGVGDDQTRFSYREEIENTAGQTVGSYSVLLDRRYRLSHEIILLECTGVSGTLNSESAHHTIYAELSIRSGDFRFKVWQEGISPKL